MAMPANFSRASALLQVRYLENPGKTQIYWISTTRHNGANNVTALTRTDLLSLEQYSEQRASFRARVMEHKKSRRVDIGPNLSLYFEDRLTIQYQVQEMLRIERIFEGEGIQEELDTYNPLIPDGHNLKATTMLEFEDEAERRMRLAELVGIEHLVWLQIEGFEKVFSISNEDLERSTDEKTSAVHFMRFELSTEMITALRGTAKLGFGCDHPNYTHHVQVTDPIRSSLLADLS
jgi:hypothetical protein